MVTSIHRGPGGIRRARDPGHFGRGHGAGATKPGGAAQAPARRQRRQGGRGGKEEMMMLRWMMIDDHIYIYIYMK